MADSYRQRQTAQASYRPKGYGISPSLQRARQPYVLRNAITGLVIGAFVTSVWAYSISAVKQDNFDDVDATALSLSVEERRKHQSIEDDEKAAAAKSVAAVAAAAAATSSRK
jgi:cytochrome c oxidase assembly factor 3